jgi:hypothetical protein
VTVKSAFSWALAMNGADPPSADAGPAASETRAMGKSSTPAMAPMRGSDDMDVSFVPETPS